MSKILITGSTGFVGTNLSPYLSDLGYTVNGISRTPKANTEISYQALNDPQTWAGTTTFIHLAGKAHDLKGTANDQEYFEVNTELTNNLFNQFLKSDCQTFIYLSSVKAAADTVSGILTEADTPCPVGPYGESKLKAEQYLLSKELPSDKRLFILRPSMIHGPGNKGNLNLLYQFVKKGLPYPLAAFDNRRSFLSISNLSFILGQIITTPDIAGGVYNMADDEALSTNKVIETLNEVAGSKAKLWKISPGFIKTMAAIGDKLHLPLNSERVKKLTESYVVSNEKIKQALKIDSLPVSSKEGLKVTIQSFSSSK